MADAIKGAQYLDSLKPTKPIGRSAWDMREQVTELWHKGLPPGDKTGWPDVDNYYSVPEGMMTFVTGWPGSGKSEWVDALQCNLVHQGWRTVFFSPENRPIELHISKLMEKLSGKPFGRGPNDRVSEQEVPEYLRKMAKRFWFLDAPDGGSLSLKAVMEAAGDWLDQEPTMKRALVVDPWNELEHWLPPGQSETMYISKTLSQARNWARNTKTHVWIVAHPKNTPRVEGKLPVPTLDMISGSQHWWNKADFGITVWIDQDNPDAHDVEIHVKKVRFKHTGRKGVATLRWDHLSGRYYAPVRLQGVR
jgi:twinkle protein